MFLATHEAQGAGQVAAAPGPLRPRRLAAARTLFEFDNVFTAPLHGFKDTPDYWARASAKPHLARCASRPWCSMRATTPLCLRPACRHPARWGDSSPLWQPAHGGHVGFPRGGYPAHVLAMPQAVADWLAAVVRALS
jgi:predicted alpha/beta-fold hydrolase